MSEDKENQIQRTNGDTKRGWLGSITAKIVGATALVAALVGLVNVVTNAYNDIANIPTNKYDKTNEELFKKHFGEAPVVSQPVEINLSSAKVAMLLQVFGSGDIFVRYGENQQWLPFKPLKLSSQSLVSEAFAQISLPLPRPAKEPSSILAPRIIIDIDQLKRQQMVDKLSSTAKPTLEKSYVLAKLKDDHPSLFSASTTTYKESFEAEPGYKIIKFNFQPGSSSHSKVERIETVPDGRAVLISFKLTSGPKVDQFRGWLNGTLTTLQEKIQ